MKKVNVLLSSYNGEKYIEELIRSVLAQEGVDVILTVRDDGSTDKTIDIIRSFNDSRIRLIIGKENLGPAKSFLTLLRDCETADYYAYCDQDDVWVQNHIEILFKNIGSNDCICGNAMLMDEDGDKLGITTLAPALRPNSRPF